MKFYAYKPVDKLGTEPLGTQNRMLFTATSIKNAHRKAQNRFGSDYRLILYANIYDERTMKDVTYGLNPHPHEYAARFHDPEKFKRIRKILDDKFNDMSDEIMSNLSSLNFTFSKKDKVQLEKMIVLYAKSLVSAIWEQLEYF